MSESRDDAFRCSPAGMAWLVFAWGGGVFDGRQEQAVWPGVRRGGGGDGCAGQEWPRGLGR